LGGFELPLPEEPAADAEGASLLETVDELRPQVRPSTLFPMDDSGELPGMPLPVQSGEAFRGGLMDAEDSAVSFLDEDTASEDVPGEAAELLAEAGVYLKYGLTEKARERLAEVVRLLPDYLPARRKLKELYVERSQHAEACGETLAIARLLLDQGQRDAAVAELQEGLALLPDEPELTGLLRRLRGSAAPGPSAGPVPIPPASPKPAATPRAPVAPPPPAVEPAFEMLGAEDSGVQEPAGAELSLAPDLIAEAAPEPPAAARETSEAFELALDEDRPAVSPSPPVAKGGPTQASLEEEELPPDLRALLEESEEEPSVHLAGEQEDLDQGMVDDLAEAEFYLSQGMGEEARSVLRRMQARAPQHPAVGTLRAKLAATGPAAVAPAESPPVPAEPVVELEAAETPLEPVLDTPEPEAPRVDEAPLLDQGMERFPGLEDLGTDAALLQAPVVLPDGEPPTPVGSLAAEGEEDPALDAGAGALTGLEGPGEPVVPKFTVQDESSSTDAAAFIDLGKELEAEMVAEEKAAAASRGGALVNELLKEFQKGVREHLDEKDFETHYNLGIAYKEMDLHDEAIQEFRLAARDPGRALTCANLIGLCHLSKGETAEAIRELKAGLEISGHPREAYHSLRYDLGVAFEAHGDLGMALECYETLQGQNARFRDVRVRAKTLRDSLRAKAAETVPTPAPAAPPTAAPAAVTEAAQPAAPPAAPGPTRRPTPKKKISFV